MFVFVGNIIECNLSMYHLHICIKRTQYEMKERFSFSTPQKAACFAVTAIVADVVVVVVSNHLVVEEA